MHEHSPSHHERGTRPRPARAGAKSARGRVEPVADLRRSDQLAEERFAGNTNHQRSIMRATAAPTARAIRGCVRAFSRNQCPDQTQSPWDQCLNLWRAHIVVEKIRNFCNDVCVARLDLHRAGCSLHVHDDERRFGFGNERQHLSSPRPPVTSFTIEAPAQSRRAPPPLSTYRLK
jgi:hypothetical protein